LVALSPVEYEHVRTAEAKALKVRAIALDKIIQKERQGQQAADGIGFNEVEPWPDPVAGNALLSDIAAAISRFIVCKPETSHAAALWIVMTWMMDVVQVAPLAVITAPEKRCGKSQLLTVLGKLSHHAMVASNITSAALFRVIDAWHPALMIDEADAFMRENEELRGILNSGHTRDSAYVVRVVGDDHTPKQFSTWGAKAIAGIGHLADTLMDRAIVLELRRKMPHESVERLRHAEHDLFDNLVSRLARFALDNREALRRSRPGLPTKLNDRAQDNWEPLLAIADLAGGVWPEQARKSALVISGADDENGTIGNELLADIQRIFEGRHLLKISSADLIKELCDDEETPWATYNRGKAITPRQVAKRLREYGIVSKNIRVGYGQSKGFDYSQFQDVFARYLTSPPSTSVPPSQPSNGKGFDGTDKESATATKNTPVPRNPSNGKGWDGGTDRNGGMERERIIEVEI
jgi:putative DNA primase/helicase